MAHCPGQTREDRRLYGIIIILLILSLLMIEKSVTIEKPDPREQQESRTAGTAGS